MHLPKERRLECWVYKANYIVKVGSNINFTSINLLINNRLYRKHDWENGLLTKM